MSDFAAAFAAHNAGRLDDAERGYRATVKRDAKHADAWHLLGVIAQQRGQMDEAVTLMRRSLDITGPQAVPLTNLGITLQALGRNTEAAESLIKAATLDPASYSAQFALANTMRALGKLSEAEAGYRKATALQPSAAPAHNNLGNTLQDQGRLPEAEAAYRRAVALDPKHIRAHYNLGIVLKETGKTEESAVVLSNAVALARQHQPTDKAVRDTLSLALADLGLLHKRQGHLQEATAALGEAADLRPDDPVIRNNLANALIDDDRAAEAEAHLRHAIAVAPAMAESHFHLGNALKAQNKGEEAVKAYESALALRPGFTKARINLGGILQRSDRYDQALAVYKAGIPYDPASPDLTNAEGVVLQLMGRTDEAFAAFDMARALKPDLAEAQRNAGLILLARGDFAAGWEAYDWRWKADGLEAGWRDFGVPLWRGEKSEGAVLLWGEQGVGDKVLHAGMISDLMAQGHGVVWETDPRLVTLFERSFPGLKVVPKANPPDPATRRGDIRWYTALASLGRWLRTDIASFPKRTSYLVADPARRAAYRAQLEQSGKGPIVGISWRSANPKIGKHKSLDLEQWAPILRTPGLRFVDLQYGDTATERAAVESELGISISHIDGLDLREDIDGVAALADACDLVIAASSTTVHIAAALGKPTWVMVPAAAGSLWYWMLEGDRTPWYPSVVIFRQANASDWTGVISEISRYLKTL